MDAQFKQGDRATICDKLDLIGRLLRATRLMDMCLKNAGMVEGFVRDFIGGKYHFVSVHEADD